MIYSPAQTDQSSIIETIDTIGQTTRRNPTGPNLSIHLLPVRNVVAFGCPRWTGNTRRSSQPDSSGQRGSIQSPTGRGCMRTSNSRNRYRWRKCHMASGPRHTIESSPFPSALNSALFQLFKSALPLTGNKNRGFGSDSSLAINRTSAYGECDVE